MKRSLAIFGLLGLVGCFLPVMIGVDSIFALRQFNWIPVILMTSAFVFPIIAGIQPGPTTVGTALTGLVCFGYVLAKFGTSVWDLAIHGESGGKMIAIAAVGGFASAALALVAGRRRAQGAGGVARHFA